MTGNADPARIAELERWHAARDCDEQGHVHPAGYAPDPDAPEPTVIRLWGSSAPARVIDGGPPCERCGAPLPRELQAPGA